MLRKIILKTKTIFLVLIFDMAVTPSWGMYLFINVILHIMNTVHYISRSSHKVHEKKVYTECHICPSQCSNFEDTKWISKKSGVCIQNVSWRAGFNFCSYRPDITNLLYKSESVVNLFLSKAIIHELFSQHQLTLWTSSSLCRARVNSSKTRSFWLCFSCTNRAAKGRQFERSMFLPHSQWLR
jgi:hypothetical protein